MKGGIMMTPRGIELASNRVISTEYDYSPSLINYHSEINKDRCYDGPCNAEKDAMIAEEEREAKNKYLQWEYMKNMQKYKENNKKFKAKKEEEKDIEKNKTMQNMKKKETSNNYNTTIRQANLKRMNSRDHSKDNKIKSLSRDAMKGKVVKKKNDNEKKTPKKIIRDKSKDDDVKEDRTVDVNVKKKIITQEEEITDSDEIKDEMNEPQSNVVIDVRTTIDQVLNQRLISKKTKAIQSILQQDDNNELTIHNNITTNLKQLSFFRQKGLISTNPTHSNHTNPTITTPSPSQTVPITKQSKLQKQRYNLALKKILIERLGARNIQIPNICSCGQLQKNLDTLLYVRNTSIYTVFKSTCANNCMYYNKRNDYEKSIQDILSSVRNLTFDSFNNKY